MTLAEQQKGFMQLFSRTLQKFIVCVKICYVQTVWNSVSMILHPAVCQNWNVFFLPCRRLLRWTAQDTWTLNMKIIPLPRPPWSHRTPGALCPKLERPRPTGLLCTDSTQLTLARTQRPSFRPAAIPRDSGAVEKQCCISPKWLMRCRMATCVHTHLTWGNLIC